MNMILGLLIGSLIGWAAFALLRFNTRQGLLTSLLIGMIGGAIGMQLAQMWRTAPGEGQLNLFALVVAGAFAGACLIIVNMITSRRSRST